MFSKKDKENKLFLSKILILKGEDNQFKKERSRHNCRIGTTCEINYLH